MEVVIIGSGAMGSLFGGRLAADEHDVTLVDTWEEHVRALNENGLVISTPDGTEQTIEVTAVTDPATIESIDVAIIFVKSIHTESALQDSAPILEDEVDVITVQNGLGNPETIAHYVPEEHVIAGTTAQGAILEGPGHITHAGQGPTLIGRYYGESDDKDYEIADQFTSAGIETEVTNTVKDIIWEKVLVNIGINAATALAKVQNGLIARTDSGRQIAKMAVSEAIVVAQAEGRSIRDDMVEYVMEVSESTAPNKSSMCQDLEAGRKTEIETLNAEIIRRAERHEISVPVNRTLTNLIRLAEEGFETDI